MSDNDREYYRQRASVERAKARTVAHERAADIHAELAEKYEALAKQSSRHDPA